MQGGAHLLIYCVVFADELSTNGYRARRNGRLLREDCFLVKESVENNVDKRDTEIEYHMNTLLQSQLPSKMPNELCIYRSCIARAEGETSFVTHFFNNSAPFDHSLGREDPHLILKFPKVGISSKKLYRSNTYRSNNSFPITSTFQMVRSPSCNRSTVL